MERRYTIRPLHNAPTRTRTAQNHLRAAEAYARSIYPASQFPLLRVRRISGSPQGNGMFLPVLSPTLQGEPFTVQKEA